ncbi:TetR/AcrR family transcriptional regulator [Actinoplanes sp. N902-109]|uniref:TetR/AcrR family transcriptional regulator n=1 Tax=Actinoplanes sp. (strain N902-109) TaxID=649831 RepID=UPI0003295D84|nr:TetR/AcrR family transcriptional regulator [Actinoplanes sp. N902-109]AGL21040.1 TetR family transcriptional regulator [Actinoplanes sp. N902-109]
MPRVSEDHLIARRAQILAAARACFLRNGLHNTSMQDLIQEAELSVGAVYRYFKSKDEIISAISETVAGALVASLREIAEDETLDLMAALTRVIDLIDQQVAPDGNFPMAVQVWSEATINPRIGEIVRERYAEMRSPFTALAERAIARGELAPGTDPAMVATALFGVIPGYALQRQLIGNPDKAAFLAGMRALLTR